MKLDPGWWRRLRVKNQFLFVISMTLLFAFCWSVISQLLFLSRAERDVGVVREVRAHDDRCGGKRRHTARSSSPRWNSNPPAAGNPAT